MELIRDDPDTLAAGHLWANPDDALRRRTLAELKTFTDWLTGQGVQGYLGEFGWPNNADTAAWNLLADKWYDAADAAGLAATQWSAGENWGTYNLLSYGASSVTSVAEVIERHPQKTGIARGVNVAGAEFAHDTLPNGTLFSNVNTGVAGSDYFYPSAAHLTHLANRGVKTIRFPFRWERVQRTLLGALDATELGLMNQVLVDANAAGLQVILDAHNYARYMLGTDANTRTELIISKSGDLNFTHLADFWSRVATWVKADATRNAAVLGYGIMNEPHSMASHTGTFAVSVTHHTFDASIEAWAPEGTSTVAHSTTTVYAGTGALAASRAFPATGYANIRVASPDRAVGSQDISANGPTLGVRVFLPADAPGTGWGAVLYLYDPGFANIQPGPTIALTKGQWTFIANDFTATQLSSVLRLGVQIDANDVNATVTVYIDEYVQGSTSGSLTPEQVWEQASQEALTGIRNVPDTRLVLVPGYFYSGITDWSTRHPAKWVTDAANNHRYEGHHYWDKKQGRTGTYKDTYDAEVQQAVADGW